MKITKKILIGIVCLIILFTIVSCDNQNGNKKEENVLGMVDNPSNNVVLSETPTPHTDYTPEWFSNIEEFNNAIFSKEKKYGIDLISYYYLPEALPDGVSLNFIQVKDAYVAIYYSIEGRTNEYYVFEWYRLLQEGQLKKGVLYSFNESSIHKVENYYIVESSSTNLSYVYWEEDGKVFHAVVPANVPSDEWSHFCSSKKIDITSAISDDKSEELIGKPSPKPFINEDTNDLEPFDNKSEEPILTPSPKPFEKEDELHFLLFDEKAETPDSPVSTEHDDYDGQIVKIGRSNVFPPVLLTNGNTNVVPHFVMYSGEIFSEFFNGMMSVRGDPINYDEMLPLLPEINGEEDWYINANGDNIVRSVTFYTIDDNSSEKIAYINDVIAPFGEKTPVKDLNNQCKDSGSYLVEIKVQVKGEFISETDKNESFVFSCLFKVIVT